MQTNDQKQFFWIVQLNKIHWKYIIVMITIKHLQMDQISALNYP